MEASSTVSENLSTDGNPRDRSIRFTLLFTFALFASRLSHQIKTFFSWRLDPLSQAADALPQKLVPQSFDDPFNSSQLKHPEAMRMSIQQPILMTWRKDLLKISKGEIHPFVQNKTLKLVVWTVLGLDCKRKGFRGRLPTLSLSQEDQVVTKIINQPGVNGLAGVLKGKLIHFVVI